MINVIYLDMDGVLCDFEKRYVEKFGESSVSARKEGSEKSNWKRFVEDREFETLLPMNGFNILVDHVMSIPNVNVEILSSTGGENYYDDVSKQKTIWLKNHGLMLKTNFVPGRKYKKQYAKADTLLIDDTVDVVDSFSLSGGYSILHKRIEETINLINIYTRIMI